MGRSRHVVGYLRDFLFRDEQARQPVKALSGGERNRLLLAKILAQPANLLILDEPTNDLDIETLDLLEEMLADYPGTLLLVSHDRDFLDRLVTSTIVFEGAGPGARICRRLQRLAAPAAGTAGRAGAAAAPGQGRWRRPRARAFPAKLQRELDRLPERIAALEARDRRARGSTRGSRALRPRPGRIRPGQRRAGRPAGHDSRRWRSVGWSWRPCARPRPADRPATAAGAQ